MKFFLAFLLTILLSALLAAQTSPANQSLVLTHFTVIDMTGAPPKPDQSLHDELALFVQAGLSPMEALQNATYNPAKYLGLSFSLGTTEKDKLADLVLLDANPLDNISPMGIV